MSVLAALALPAGQNAAAAGTRLFLGYLALAAAPGLAGALSLGGFVPVLRFLIGVGHPQVGRRTAADSVLRQE